MFLFGVWVMGEEEGVGFIGSKFSHITNLSSVNSQAGQLGKMETFFEVTVAHNHTKFEIIVFSGTNSAHGFHFYCGCDSTVIPLREAAYSLLLYGYHGQN